MKVAVKQVYTSVACNRLPEIVDWNNDGLICFGASKAVVIYDTNVKGKDPLTVYSHHRSTVNSVKWVRKPDGSSTELVSCSADKTGAIWTLDNGQYKVTNELAAHSEPVTCVYGIYTKGDDLIVYTGSVDSTVNIWQRVDGVTTLKQKLNLNSGLCLTLHAHLLPVVAKPMLLCALDDHKIHVFAENSDGEYHRAHTLVGHDDWVRGMDVLNVDGSTILVASCSQDTYIRVWRISVHRSQPKPAGIQVEQQVFSAHGSHWAVTLDAVLAAHEGWVYGVQWHPSNTNSNEKPVYRLLSSSLDRTIIVWEPEGDGSDEGAGTGGGAWVERVRVGEVGGNGLGFYGSRFGPRGDSFLGHGYNGSFHVWTLDKETNQWSPSVVIGGHFGAVEDVQWEPVRGRYLVSVSADQTTRLHAPWVRPDDHSVEWHEISRPQVHGFDMSSVALVSSTLFASSAEEKVIRVFRAPHNFVHNFRNITGELLEGDTGGPQGATVPSLGLSNKAVYAGDENDPDLEDDSDGYFVPVNLTEPPTEETLMQNTLWPEVHKLYGHGYEVFALAASADGALLASACKAATVEHAAVLLWETKTWRQIQKLTSHSLTVTQLAFSPDSQYLLSVSRDRRWTLYERQPQSVLFTQVSVTDKSNGVHTRIIWCCAWAHDGAMFATGSRDGKICAWKKTEKMTESSLGQYGLVGKPLDVAGVSITALAFAPLTIDGARVIATGFDVGVIRLYSFDGCEWSLLKDIGKSAAHHMTVKRLSFKPGVSDDEELLLASCGVDHFVRIHGITIR